MVGSWAANAGRDNPIPVPPAPAAMQHRVRPARGFTLIEVLVALIVLVLGVLGAAGMTLTALRDSKQSGMRSQAVALAYELADMIRANFNNEDVFRAAAPVFVVSACYSPAGCSPAEMAQNEFYLWTQKMSIPGTSLPNAETKICRDSAHLDSMTTCDGSADSPLVIKMTWDEKLNDGTFISRTPTSPPRLVMPVQPY